MNSRTLVIYYSRSGNTRTLAQELAVSLRADLEEIRTPASYRPGPLGYLQALFDSVTGRLPKIETAARELAGYNLVIVGGPVWGSGPAAPVTAFLRRYGRELGKVAFFATQGGFAGRPRLFRIMQEACGKAPVATLAVSEKKPGAHRDEVDSFVKRIQGFATELELEVG